MAKDPKHQDDGVIVMARFGHLTGCDTLGADDPLGRVYSKEGHVVHLVCLPRGCKLKMKVTSKAEKEIATIAGGCFWCLEAVFDLVDGVDAVVSGYTGGHTENPTYEEICTGSTGHAEAVQIKFDKTTLDYKTVLEIFFAYHDPTTLNREGNDVGTQYRSAVFCHDDYQENIARSVIARLEREGIFSNPIVTEINRIGQFYGAEDYHQSYFKNNPKQPYCQLIIAPKVMKLREKHALLLKTDDQRTGAGHGAL